MSKEKKSLLVFYGITLPVSLIFELLYIFTKSDLFVSILMWVPGITGIVCSKVFFRNQGALGFKFKIKPLYIILSIVIPVIYLVLTYVLAWVVLKDPTTGIDTLPQAVLGEWGEGIPGGIYFAVSFIPFLIFSALSAAGEELGWRGFPAFNCEKTLEETLDSVIGQTYRDLEVILINDSSTDGTSAICDRYARKDARIRYYVNSKNIGTLETRPFARLP